MLRIELTDPAVLLTDKRMGPQFPGQMTGQFPGVAAQSGDWATLRGTKEAEYSGNKERTAHHSSRICRPMAINLPYGEGR